MRKCGWSFRIFVRYMPFQVPVVVLLHLLLVLAYYIADFKGNDVDQPRNLAKSVTVE